MSVTSLADLAGSRLGSLMSLKAFSNLVDSMILCGLCEADAAGSPCAGFKLC